MVVYKQNEIPVVIMIFVVQFLFDCASSANPEVKEVALHMFASVPGVFGNQGKRP